MSCKEYMKLQKDREKGRMQTGMPRLIRHPTHPNPINYPFEPFCRLSEKRTHLYINKKNVIVLCNNIFRFSVFGFRFSVFGFRFLFEYGV